jgi:hypothetical protein
MARLGFFRGFLPVILDIQTLASTSKVQETSKVHETWQGNARHTYTHNYIPCISGIAV